MVISDRDDHQLPKNIFSYNKKRKMENLPLNITLKVKLCNNMTARGFIVDRRNPTHYYVNYHKHILFIRAI